MFMFSSSSVPHLITLNLAKNGAFAALKYNYFLIYLRMYNIATYAQKGGALQLQCNAEIIIIWLHNSKYVAFSHGDKNILTNVLTVSCSSIYAVTYVYMVYMCLDTKIEK